MGQGDDDIQRTSNTPNGQRVQNSLHSKGSKAQSSPTFQQLLQCDDSKWSRISSQIKKKNRDQEADGNSHNKKSVLAKVKEKAKKLKLSLSWKKHSGTNESRCSATLSSGVGPKNKGEEDTEYSAQRKHLDQELNVKQTKDELASFTNSTEPHVNIYAPSDPSVIAAADADTKKQTAATTDVPKVQEFSERNSRFSSGLMVSTPESKSNRSVEEGEHMNGALQTRDKSVSVKEYLMHKFEPGEDERALSKVITQTISPRRDKVREAMSSFLKNEESPEANSSNVDNNIVNLDFKSKSLPASTSLNTNTGSKTGPIKQSYSLGSNASKASFNLNQTFKSTFASYQDRFISSSSNNNTILSYTTSSSSTNTKPGSTNQSLTHLNSPNKTSSSPLGHASNAKETQASVSGPKKTRVPSHTATSVRRVPVSRPHHANATRTPRSTGMPLMLQWKDSQS